jgi:hypothetical protein
MADSPHLGGAACRPLVPPFPADRCGRVGIRQAYLKGASIATDTVASTSAPLLQGSRLTRRSHPLNTNPRPDHLPRDWAARHGTYVCAAAVRGSRTAMIPALAVAASSPRPVIFLVREDLRSHTGQA